MCHGGDSSVFSQRFVSAQLHAHYKHANECAEEGGFWNEPDIDLTDGSDYRKYTHVRGLAEWFLAGESAQGLVSKDTLLFAASFAEPTLDFICNHEAALRLTITRGYMNIAHGTGKAADSSDKRVQSQ